MISRLDLWNDTGYTESGVERPPIGASIRQPDFSYTDLKPDKGELFSRVSLKAPYTDLMDVSYVRIYLDTANGDDKIIYGWVDSVALRSDTDGYPLTDISWHVDPWRTWCAQAEFRTGMVRRRPMTGDIPPQPYPFRFRTAGAAHDLVPNDGIWWALMNYIKEDEQGVTTMITWTAIPVNANLNDSVYISAAATGQTVYRCPSLNMLLMGYFEELYGFDPKAVVSLCLSPIPPMEVSGSGTQNAPYYTGANSHWNVDPTVPGTYGMFKAYGGSSGSKYTEYTGTLSSQVSTSDTLTWAVRDLTGSVIGALPWGLKVRNYTYRVVNAILTQYIQIRFDGTDSAPEGLSFTIPLPLLSVTSNSWSSYVYSGQRTVDMRARELATMDAFASSLESTIGSATSTMGLGAMFGGTDTVKGVNTMKGGIATAAGGLFSGVLDYLYRTQWNRNGLEQDMYDYSAAHQTDNILLPGDGEDFIYKGTHISLIALETDAYSRGVRNSDIELYGAHVSEPMASCQSLVEQGGPLQIANLTVGGDIPVEAKEYMRAMFSNGVRLV